MTRRLLRVAAAAVLAALTVASVSITEYLSLLEKGMGQNLQAVQREVVAQKSIQAQNAALNHMVSVTNSMTAQVTAMSGAADTILANIRKVGEANRAVVGANSALVKSGGATFDQLQRVSTSLDEMTAAARDLSGSMAVLAETVSVQRESLDSVLWYVAGMNARTPELQP